MLARRVRVVPGDDLPGPCSNGMVAHVVRAPARAACCCRRPSSAPCRRAGRRPTRGRRPRWRRTARARAVPCTPAPRPGCVGDLVPGQHVVGGDVEDASPIARGWPSSGTKPRAKSAWWVSVHSEVPSPCTTTWLALAHPGEGRPAAVERHERPVVGVRRPHDRRREAVVAVGADEQVLAGDLVAGVLPERVAQRRGLRRPAAGPAASGTPTPS